MNKKLLMLLAAGALVITGCAGKEASKTSDQKNNPEQKENKKEKGTRITGHSALLIGQEMVRVSGTLCRSTDQSQRHNELY